MEKEENVYAENTQTEEKEIKGAGEAEERDSARKEASAVLGKFKDVDALARAYESLQAEFTRRSQRLKELEKRAENLQADGQNAGASGAEKLRKHAEARRAETKEFDGYVAEVASILQGADKGRPEQEEDVPSASAADETEGGGAELAKGAEETDPEKKGTKAVENTAKETLGGGKLSPSVAESGNAEDPSRSLYEQASRDEKVRLRIIGEYLASVGKGGAPLTASGVGTLAAPPLRARNIADAGDMALQYFKKPLNG